MGDSIGGSGGRQFIDSTESSEESDLPCFFLNRACGCSQSQKRMNEWTVN